MSVPARSGIATNAHYRVASAEGDWTVVIDQSKAVRTVSLGQFELNENSTVEVSNVGANGIVVADSVFVTLVRCGVAVPPTPGPVTTSGPVTTRNPGFTTETPRCKPQVCTCGDYESVVYYSDGSDCLKCFCKSGPGGGSEPITEEELTTESPARVPKFKYF